MSSPSDIETQQADGDTKNDGDSDPSEDSQAADFTAKTAHSSKSRILLPVEAAVLDMIASYHSATERGGGEDDGEDDDEDRRRTQLYFGYCCDMRCASLTVDCLYVPWMINSVFFNLGLYEEALEMGIEDTGRFNPLVLLAIKNGIGAFFGVIGIIGCCRMHSCLVLATGIWFCADVLWSLLFGRYVMLALVFNIYPHFFLFEALRSGKITRDNYRRREQHCCWDRNKE